MQKPDANQFAVQSLITQAFNLPVFLRGQVAAVRNQMTMVNANAEQKALLGDDAATIEALLSNLETAATAAETKLGSA